MTKKASQVYRDFPLRIVLYRAPLLVGTIAVGAIVSASLGWIALWAFLVYTVWAILWTMKHSCRNCAYHGKRCDLGVSLAAAILYPVKGDIKLFRAYTTIALWLLGIMLVIPLIIGIAGLVFAFSSNNLIWFSIYTLAVTAVIYTTVLSCPHCAMRNICPLSFYRG